MRWNRVFVGDRYCNATGWFGRFKTADRISLKLVS